MLKDYISKDALLVLHHQMQYANNLTKNWHVYYQEGYVIHQIILIIDTINDEFIEIILAELV